MKPFRFLRPRTLREFHAALDESGQDVTFLAGGTDLVVRLRLGHIRPRVVVDLKQIGELPSDVREAEGSVRIGGGAVMADVMTAPLIQKHFPALVDAVSVVGSVQIRNRATIAGNICNASPAADTAPVLLAYGARVNVIGRNERKTLPLSGFFEGPGKTVLAPEELVESVDLPIPSRRSSAAFGRITRRSGVDIATISVCCFVSDREPARFAFGAAGPTPIVVEEAIESMATDADRQSALARAIAHTTPIADIRGGREYRSAMLSVVGRRVLKHAIERLRHA